MKIGLKLGADVPLSVLGQNALVEGVGEKLMPITLPSAVFMVTHPCVHVPTLAIFSDEGLTRGTPLTIIMDFPDQQIVFAYSCNDLQAVAERKYGEIVRALAWPRQFDPLARMIGPGARVFAPFDGVEHTQAVTGQVLSEWEGRCTTGLTYHLLARFAVQSLLLSLLQRRW